MFGLGSTRLELCQTLPPPWRSPVPGCLQRLGNKLHGCIRRSWPASAGSAICTFTFLLLPWYPKKLRRCTNVTKKDRNACSVSLDWIPSAAWTTLPMFCKSKAETALEGRPRVWTRPWACLQQHEQCCQWFARARPLERSWGDAQKSIGRSLDQTTQKYPDTRTLNCLCDLGVCPQGQVGATGISGLSIWRIRLSIRSELKMLGSLRNQFLLRRTWLQTICAAKSHGAMPLIQFGQPYDVEKAVTVLRQLASCSAWGQGVGRKPWLLPLKSMVNPRKLKTGSSGLSSLGRELQQRGSFRQS